MSSIRVLIVDDQTLFVESVKLAIEDRRPIGEVRIQQRPDRAIEEIRGFRPTVVLLDIHLPGMDGLDLARAIKAESPRLPVIMLTAFGYDSYVQRAIEAGTAGFILKDKGVDALHAAIVDAASGRLVFDKVADRVLKTASIQSRHSGSALDELPDWYMYLTRRELKVLYFIAHGFSNSEIAEKLCLASQTVRNYVSLVYDKIGAGNRFEAIRTAIESDIDSLVRRIDA